ncbi:hypothetical protein KY359_01380 [Candidatus Woesearchaeota archaeon]|nr:hypothetical protein [Candidatus Woesearchaeota archaeon]
MVGRRIRRHLSETEKRNGYSKRSNGYSSEHVDAEATGSVLKKVIYTGLALLATGFVCSRIIADYNKRNPLDGHTPCTYTVQAGDTLTGLCQGEGFHGDELQSCIDQLCRDNRHNRLPDGTTPVFDPLNGNCNSMRVGGTITFVDADGDGKVNGQECVYDQ